MYNTISSHQMRCPEDTRLRQCFESPLVYLANIEYVYKMMRWSTPKVRIFSRYIYNKLRKNLVGFEATDKLTTRVGFRRITFLRNPVLNVKRKLRICFKSKKVDGRVRIISTYTNQSVSALYITIIYDFIWTTQTSRCIFLEIYAYTNNLNTFFNIIYMAINKIRVNFF